MTVGQLVAAISRRREKESSSHKRERAKRSSARQILRVASELLSGHHGDTISPSVLQYLNTDEGVAAETDSMSFNAWPEQSVATSVSAGTSNLSMRLDSDVKTTGALRGESTTDRAEDSAADGSQCGPQPGEVGPLIKSLIRAADRISEPPTAAEQPAGSDLLDLCDLAEPACLSASEVEALFQLQAPSSTPAEAEEIPGPCPVAFRIDSDEELADSELLEATVKAE